MKYVYEVLITGEEEKTLFWLAEHGYDGSFVDSASAVDPQEVEGVDEYDQDKLYLFTEPDAWKVMEYVKDDENAFLACSACSTLNEKLLAFVERIV